MALLRRSADGIYIALSFFLAFLGSYVAVNVAEHYRLSRYNSIYYHITTKNLNIPLFQLRFKMTLSCSLNICIDKITFVYCNTSALLICLRNKTVVVWRHHTWVLEFFSSWCPQALVSIYDLPVWFCRRRFVICETQVLKRLSIIRRSSNIFYAFCWDGINDFDSGRWFTCSFIIW